MTDDPRAAPDGWNLPRPERLPPPSAWPALAALGVTLFGWGIVSARFLLLVGGALVMYALGHWIGEILHEES